jgi:3-hydroxybutyryl-CoA dehydratase
MADGCRHKHSLQRSFTQQDIDTFTRMTGDSNPIHRGAKAIVPGLLAASLFPAIIGSANPGVLYAKQDLSFRQAIGVHSVHLTI